jgi:hypothetical protein
MIPFFLLQLFLFLFFKEGDSQRQRQRSQGQASMTAIPMPRFTRLPITLYRVQAKLPVSLRSFQDQVAKGRSSFDLTLQNGLVLPVKEGSAFEGPNGMSLRPSGANMTRILREFKGTPMVFRLHEGLLLPPGLVVFHEHTDHYSMQTDAPISLDALNAKLTELLQSLPPPQTRDQFFAADNDEDDQDN